MSAGRLRRRAHPHNAFADVISPQTVSPLQLSFPKLVLLRCGFGPSNRKGYTLIPTTVNQGSCEDHTGILDWADSIPRGMERAARGSSPLHKVPQIAGNY